MLKDAIERNRQRHARYAKYDKILRQIRLRLFEYEDAGVDPEKVLRVIQKCRDILSPLWKAKDKAREVARKC